MHLKNTSAAPGLFWRRPFAGKPRPETLSQKISAAGNIRLTICAPPYTMKKINKGECSSASHGHSDEASQNLG